MLQESFEEMFNCRSTPKFFVVLREKKANENMFLCSIPTFIGPPQMNSLNIFYTPSFFTHLGVLIPNSIY